jgi:hypothetical protein
MGISISTRPDLYLEMQRVNSTSQMERGEQEQNLDLIVPPITEEEWDNAA